MGPEREPSLEELRTAFCNGDQNALDGIFDICFEEIYFNISKGLLKEQRGELFLLKYDIAQDPSILCGKEGNVSAYLRAIWKKRLRGLKPKEKSTGDGSYFPSKGKNEIDTTSTTSESVKKYPIYYRYFLSAYAPIDRVLYDVKYGMGLVNRNGLFLVMQFLLNTVATGNKKMLQILKKQDAIYEPMIPEFLKQKALATYTNIPPDLSKGPLDSLLEGLKVKEEQSSIEFDKICHTREVYTSRKYREFNDKLRTCAPLNELEKAIYFINEYLPLEDFIELWQKLNLDAKEDETLAKALKDHQLSNKNFLKKNRKLRRKTIMKRMEIGLKKEKQIAEIIKGIQNGIDEKLNTKTKWKTS